MSEKVNLIIADSPAASVIVSEGERVEALIGDSPPASVFVSESQETGIVKVITEGPQGPPGPAGVPANLGEIPDVDATAKTQGSVLYYDAGRGLFVADSSVTTSTITDGGNF